MSREMIGFAARPLRFVIYEDGDIVRRRGHLPLLSHKPEAILVLERPPVWRGAARRALPGLAIIGTCIMPPASGRTASPPTFTIQGRPGAVTSLTIRLPAGRRIVADRMIDTAAFAKREKAAFAGAGAMRKDCAWASAVRPFTRLRGYARKAAPLWSWDLAKEGIAMQLPGRGIPGCVSPDGRRLIVAVLRSSEEDLSMVDALQGFAVISTVTPSGFVDQADTAGAERFGNPRMTSPVGWRAGCGATLRYEIDVREEPSIRTVEGRFSGKRRC